MKKICINELYDDYKIIEELGRNGGHMHYKMRCTKCGHIKICADSNIIKQCNNHSHLNCKKDFYKEYINKKFGDYECIDICNENKEFKLVLKCNVCGNVIKINLCNLKNKFKHSANQCGEKYFDNFVGQEYGDFKVLSKNKEKIYGDRKYICECKKCKIKIKKSSKSLLKNNFIHGDICFRYLEENEEIKKTFAERFNDMKQRCNNEKNTNYHYYGQRNIKLKYDYVIDLYIDFIDEFKKHCKIYGLKNSTFDRIDVNGNYEKNNLRITTQEIQCVNCTDRKFFILKKDKEVIISDSAMNVGKHYNINGRAIGNLVRGQSKNSYGWKLVKILKNVTKENLDEIIKQEGVTTNLIISL